MTAPSSPQRPVTVSVFSQRFSATTRGARLARHLALHQLHTWGIPHGTETSDAAAVIVAELAANAVTHGRVPGRDFELRLSLVTGSVRIEVSDTRSGPPRPPRPGGTTPPAPLAEGGRGFLLVDAFAARWEVLDRDPPPGKTVRAEVDVPGWLYLVRDRTTGARPGPAL
ncbi:ATP-binding protein [Streptomyces gibsoniae]|uniref:ATP-binding protein n=1 Tax=Streptomyces gibsoniae TaxID=3075529 RepID=A0ABU2TYC5_9ACTN|nr:ATP-binding protein [Streptomyces sp. DSM 41699]MDT0465979.1 ATP-binding protein [Streptomyces sp. DSM 41699]